MRRVAILAGLALAVSVLLPGSALPAAGGSDLPVKGSPSGHCTLNLVTAHGHCVTTGPTSHFGLSTLQQDLQLVPTGPGTFSWSSSTWTLTAANGDQMFGTATGTGSTLDDVHFTFLGHYVSTDGTGRFADASLTLDTTAQITALSVEGPIATSFSEVTLVGTLSY